MSNITVNPVTRIEGHAKITLDTDDSGAVSRGHLQVLEIRGFEKLLEGMELFKMPLITGRICGVCPAAHHMASVTAIESGLGIDIPEAAAKLRELMYMGHILHSHALSTFVLTGPDILAGLSAAPEQRNVFNLLKMQPDVVKKVLRLRSIGQRVVEIVGGRGVHPVTSVPGGITSAPSDEEMSSMAEWGQEALDILGEMVPVVEEKLEAMADIRDAAELPFSSAGLSDDGQVSFFQAPCVVMDDEGNVTRTFEAPDYADHLVEHAMEGSYMKSVRLRGDTESNFFVGPMARLNINQSFSTPKATEMLAAYREKGHPRKSALDFIEARLVEMVHCAERIGELASAGVSGDLLMEAQPVAGRFMGMVEAPRGILIHEYETDDDGTLTGANLIVATQNNYDAIDHSITALASLFADSGDDNLLMNGVEFALRCYDPCLACATHVAGRMPMIVEVRRNGETVRKFERGAEQ